MLDSRGSTMAAFFVLFLLTLQVISVNGSFFGLVKGGGPASEIHLIEQDVKLPKPISEVIKTLNSLHKMDTCPKMATKNLLFACEGYDGTSSQDRRSTADHLEVFQKVFAVQMTSCELQAAQQPMPLSCAPLLEPNLGSISESQIKVCLDAVWQDQNAWTTFMSVKTHGLVMCQAIRGERDREEDIHLHKELIKVAQSLSQSLVLSDEAFAAIYKQMGELKGATLDFYNAMNGDMAVFKADIKKSWATIAKDVAAVGSNMSGLLEHMQSATNGVTMYTEKVDEAFQQAISLSQLTSSSVDGQLQGLFELIGRAREENQYQLQLVLDDFAQRAGGAASDLEMINTQLGELGKSLDLLDTGLAAPLQKVERLNIDIDKSLHLQQNIHDKLGDMDAQANATFEKLAAATEEAGKVLNLVASVTGFLQGFLGSLERIIGASWATCVALLVCFTLVTCGGYKIMSPLLGSGVGLLAASLSAFVITPIIVFFCNPVDYLREVAGNNGSIAGVFVMLAVSYLLGFLSCKFIQRKQPSQHDMSLPTSENNALYDPASPTYEENHGDSYNTQIKEQRCYY